MTTVLVSVMCLTYNHEKTIRKCLEGFIMQKTNFKFEVCIHDDASNDNTVSIIKEYEEKYPHLLKCIFQKENQYSTKGLGEVRRQQYAKDRVKGTYMAWCEGDDYWTDPNKLQAQVDMFKSDNSLGLIHTDFDIYLESRQITLNSVQSLTLNTFVGDCKRKYWSSSFFYPHTIKTCTVMMKTSIYYSAVDCLESNGANLIVDFGLFFYCAYYHNIGFLDRSTTVYRRTEGSLSNQTSTQKQLEFQRTLLALKGILVNALCLSEYYSRVLDNNKYLIESRLQVNNKVIDLRRIRILLTYKVFGLVHYWPYYYKKLMLNLQKDKG